MAAQQVGDGHADGVCLPNTKLGFYGTTPIAKRAAAAQATSLVGTASSTAVDTNLKAAVIEIMNTMAAHGLWTGSA